MGENERIESSFPRLNAGVGKLLDSLKNSTFYIDTDKQGFGSEDKPFKFNDNSKCLVFKTEGIIHVVARCVDRDVDTALNITSDFSSGEMVETLSSVFGVFAIVEDSRYIVNFNSAVEFYLANSNGSPVKVYDISLNLLQNLGVFTGGGGGGDNSGVISRLDDILENTEDLFSSLTSNDVFIDTFVTGNGSVNNPYLITDLSKAYVFKTTGVNTATDIFARSTTRSKDFYIKIDKDFVAQTVFKDNTNNTYLLLAIEDDPFIFIFSSPTELYFTDSRIAVYNIPIDSLNVVVDKDKKAYLQSIQANTDEANIYLQSIQSNTSDGSSNVQTLVDQNNADIIPTLVVIADNAAILPNIDTNTAGSNQKLQDIVNYTETLVYINSHLNEIEGNTGASLNESRQTYNTGLRFTSTENTFQDCVSFMQNFFLNNPTRKYIYHTLTPTTASNYGIVIAYKN